MSEAIQAYPLTWPAGWRRTENHRRERAKFAKGRSHMGTSGWVSQQALTVSDGVQRVLAELGRMYVSRDNVVISTNVPTRLDGLPMSNTRVPADPGAAVYWRKGKETRCMAIDRYDRVQDNLAAIAATLDAMRAIERHGGATILDRAFQGFTALPSPEQWFTVLGVPAAATIEQIDEAYRRLAMKHHPDRPGGSEQEMQRINAAREQGIEAMRS